MFVFKAPVARSLRLLRAYVGACLGGLTLLIAWLAPAHAADPVWADPKLPEAARKEGSLVVYSSINEEEGLPIWRNFEQSTGIKVDYVRGSDAQLIARMMIESRAGRGAWDLVLITAAHKLPQPMLAQIDPPEAQQLFPAARDPNRRWFGFSANYNVPAYNANLIKAADLPQSYEELAKRSDWAGCVAVNEYDSEWVKALLEHYGESKGQEILRNLGTTLKPAILNRTSGGSARGRLRRIPDRAHQLRQSHPEREACRRADELLGDRPGWRILYADERIGAGPASERSAAGRELHPQSGGTKPAGGARPHPIAS